MDKEFPDHWKGKYGPIPLLPHSPDLTPLGFSFWRFVKDNVYCEKVKNVNEMLNRIVRAAECVTK
jgi:hypothetical protein